MKILLYGKNGQVGWELERSLSCIGELIALDRASEIYCGDVKKFEKIRNDILAINPDVIVNATAYTAVDNAEVERDEATLINVEVPSYISSVAKECNALFVHYSTDYVFSGEGSRPWVETDNTGPVNFYGLSKLQGEQAVIDNLDDYLIFRTSWVYANRGKNFVKSMLRLMEEREDLNIISDQIGAPTSAAYIADVTAHCIKNYRKEFAGIYNLTAFGETSWFNYAKFIFECRSGFLPSIKTKRITAILSDEYKTQATRPKNSRLNCEKLCRVFGISQPDWRWGVKRIVAEIMEKND
ncbi:dTDP-4-dehydrorhamnose reductase [Cellvibrio mixtus]|uniref:dTDP-4-dehydrorhamnose reductase n=1 Tax=Cellvibrio mixtus TaxID=39650 RepID=UPI000586D997|nr:dTDP-4-dehydrorhamnose reductase [Cellvibrio mixtus]